MQTPIHANHQGSIIAHSNSAGAVVNTLAYDAYGIPASANVGSFAYTGQVWIKELGMYHYKARVYAPKMGRFLQTDPVGYKDDMDLYSYVGNDPVNKTDPTGMEGEVCSSTKGVCMKTPEVKLPTISVTVLKTGGKTAQANVKVSLDPNKKTVSTEVNLKTKDANASVKVEADPKAGTVTTEKTAEISVWEKAKDFVKANIEARVLKVTDAGNREVTVSVGGVGATGNPENALPAADTLRNTPQRREEAGLQ